MDGARWLITRFQQKDPARLAALLPDVVKSVETGASPADSRKRRAVEAQKAAMDRMRASQKVSFFFLRAIRKG